MIKKIYFEEIESTNDYALNHDEPEDFAVIAKKQTGGKGTKGRSFSSEVGGAYLTLVRYYPLRVEQSFKIMVSSCLAVAKTLASYGVNASIKWANDVYVNGKKICGILIKNVFEGEFVKKSVIGIGVNLNNEIPSALKDIAVTAKEIINREIDAGEFIDRLIENLYQDYSMDEYRLKNLVLGRKIKVIEGENSYFARATEIADNGNLILSDGKVLSYGEVSVAVRY